MLIQTAMIEVKQLFFSFFRFVQCFWYLSYFLPVHKRRTLPSQFHRCSLCTREISLRIIHEGGGHTQQEKIGIFNLFIFLQSLALKSIYFYIFKLFH